MITLLLVGVGIYVGFALLVYFSQERMVFLRDLPGRDHVASPEVIGLEYEDVGIGTADGERLHAWYVPASGDGVLLFFHGNAGNISHRLDSLAIFHDLGLDVLMVDYRGYGRSSGTPDEAGTYADADAAWRHLTQYRGVPPGRIVIFGRSLGAAVAARLASRVRPGAVIIESSFTSGLAMGKRLYPLLPMDYLVRLRYPVIEYVADFNAPVLVVHSRDDEIIPFEMGEALYAAAPEPRQFLELAGDHNMGFLQSRERYVAGLRRFLRDAGIPAR